MNVVFLGGCHLVGKPHGVSAGFVRQLWKRWRQIDRTVHFEILPYAVQWQALFDACREALKKDPDLFVLNIQSGLVLPTWERTMKRIGLKQGESMDATENWFAPLAWKPQARGAWYWRAKRLGILALGGHREKWSWIEREWNKLAQEFQISRTRVIVMTPTPVKDEFFIRGTSNLERVRKIVLTYREGYEVFDALTEVQTLGEAGLWFDGQHISRDAHVLIANQLWSMICEKGAYPCNTIS